MRNKKVVVTAVVTCVLTTAFYLTPAGDAVRSFLEAASGKMTFSQKMDKMTNLIDKYYIGDYDKTLAEEDALSAYAYSLGDQYTMYIDKDNYSSMMESLGGDYQGIGVEVTISDGAINIVSVFENSPAQKAGMKIGDKIVAVDGETANADNYQESINKIKGVNAEEGDSDVVVTVERGGERIDMTVVRDTVSVDTVYSKVLNPNIGYIRITDFGQKTDVDFKNQLDRLTADGIKGLIIDLRNNPGGMLTTVVNIADELLPEGVILTVRDKSGKENQYKSDNDCMSVPLCVLINGNSASASEVLSGAIRDHGRGKLIGEKSFGKGVVQSIVEFGDGSAFKLTTAKYYTPSGECIDQTGIKPDIEVKLGDAASKKQISELTLEEDEQLRTALQVLN